MMAKRGRPQKVLSPQDLFELEKFLMDLNCLKKNQKQANQILQSKQYYELDEKDLSLLKVVHREKIQFEQRKILLNQIEIKKKNQQQLLANEIEILKLNELYKYEDQSEENFFRLDRALESYQKIQKAALENRIRVENEHRREILNKTHKKLTEAQKRRNAENQLKYALGGLVLSLWRKKGWRLNPDDLGSVESIIIENVDFGSKLADSTLYKDAIAMTGDHDTAKKLILSLIDKLPNYKIRGEEFQKVILGELYKV